MRLCQDHLCLRLCRKLQFGTDAPPLSEEELRPFLDDLCAFCGVPLPEAHEFLSVQAGQPFRLNVLEKLLQMTHDPEAAMCADLRRGVRIGVDHDLVPSAHWPLRHNDPVCTDLNICEGSWKVLRIIRIRLGNCWSKKLRRAGSRNSPLLNLFMLTFLLWRLGSWDWFSLRVDHLASPLTVRSAVSLRLVGYRTTCPILEFPMLRTAPQSASVKILSRQYRWMFVRRIARLWWPSATKHFWPSLLRGGSSPLTL